MQCAGLSAFGPRYQTFSLAQETRHTTRGLFGHLLRASRDCFVVRPLSPQQSVAEPLNRVVIGYASDGMLPNSGSENRLKRTFHFLMQRL